MHQFTVKLYDAATGRAISHDGKVIVMDAASPDKVSLLDSSGAAASNPAAIVDGAVTFYTAETTKKVDLSIYTDYGCAKFVRDITPGAPIEIAIDITSMYQTLIVPFSVAHSGYAAATEMDSGLDLVVGQQVIPFGLGIRVTTADATETLDVGLDGSGAEDDPNGILEAISVATAGYVQGTIGFAVGTNNTVVDLTGGTQEWTYGALLHPAGAKVNKSEGGDAAATDGNGFAYLEPHICAASGADITWTLTTGSDTAKGYIILPLFLPFPATLS